MTTNASRQTTGNRWGNAVHCPIIIRPGSLRCICPPTTSPKKCVRSCAQIVTKYAPVGRALCPPGGGPCARPGAGLVPARGRALCPPGGGPCARLGAGLVPARGRALCPPGGGPCARPGAGLVPARVSNASRHHSSQPLDRAPRPAFGTDTTVRLPEAAKHTTTPHDPQTPRRFHSEAAPLQTLFSTDEPPGTTRGESRVRKPGKPNRRLR